MVLWTKISKLLFSSSFHRNLVGKNLTLELGLFLDASAYAVLSEFSSSEDTVDLIMAAINQVQALYSLPSLGSRGLQLTITFLEIQLRPPPELLLFNGQQLQLLGIYPLFYNIMNNFKDIS